MWLNRSRMSDWFRASQEPSGWFPAIVGLPVGKRNGNSGIGLLSEALPEDSATGLARTSRILASSGWIDSSLGSACFVILDSPRTARHGLSSANSTSALP